jgi:hypothetical protein
VKHTPLTFFLTLFLGGVVCCGQTTSGEKDPSPFDQFREGAGQSPVGLGCQQDPKGWGCAYVQTSGSVVGGEFGFEGLFVSCRKGLDGLEVEMNSSVTQTLQTAQTVMRIALAGSALNQGSYLCSGFELAESGEPKARTCSVAVQTKGLLFVTSDPTPCNVVIRNSKPLTGKFSCGGLFSGTHDISVSTTSVFQCQKGVSL